MDEYSTTWDPLLKMWWYGGIKKNKEYWTHLNIFQQGKNNNSCAAYTHPYNNFKPNSTNIS